MQGDRPPSDGQAKAQTPAGAAAVGFNADKRLEDRLLRAVRNTGPVVPYRDDDSTGRRPHLDLDCRPLGRMLNRVAKHVLGCTAEELGVTEHSRGTAAAEVQAAVFGLGLQGAVATRALVQKQINRDLFVVASLGIALGGRQLEQLFDKVGQAVNLTFDAVERPLAIVAGAGEAHGQSEAQPAASVARARRPAKVGAPR